MYWCAYIRRKGGGGGEGGKGCSCHRETHTSWWIAWRPPLQLLYLQEGAQGPGSPLYTPSLAQGGAEVVSGPWPSLSMRGRGAFVEVAPSSMNHILNSRTQTHTFKCNNNQTRCFRKQWLGSITVMVFVKSFFWFSFMCVQSKTVRKLLPQV